MADNFVDGNELDPFDPRTDALDQSQLKNKIAHDVFLFRTILELRMRAYRRVFVEGAPSMEDRALVLEDLQSFCRHGASTYHDNERIHVLLSGRQEVTLRIDDFTRLPIDTLLAKYTQPQ